MYNQSVIKTLNKCHTVISSCLTELYMFFRVKNIYISDILELEIYHVECGKDMQKLNLEKFNTYFFLIFFMQENVT